MKKAILAIVIFSMMVFVLGCDPVGPTNDVEKTRYYAGETVRFYDNKTNGQLGTLKISNVTVLQDEPYTEWEYVCDTENFSPSLQTRYKDAVIKGSKVYSPTVYAAVVEIEYEAQTLDSSLVIDSRNFEINDCNNNPVDRTVNIDYEMRPTEANSMVVGLLEKGELRLGFSLHTGQMTNTTIICEYDYNSNAYIIRNDETADPECTSCHKKVDKGDLYCRYCGNALK